MPTWAAKRHDREPHREKVDLKQILGPARGRGLPAAVRDREARKDYVKYLAPTFELADPAAKRPPGSGARLATLHRDGRWVLEFDAFPDPADPTDYRGSLVLEDLFQPLVGSLPFDDILLASENGDIVYQSKKNGPEFTTLAALLENQAGSAGKKPAANPPGTAPKADPVSIHMTDVVLAGTSYKLSCSRS